MGGCDDRSRPPRAPHSVMTRWRGTVACFPFGVQIPHLCGERPPPQHTPSNLTPLQCLPSAQKPTSPFSSNVALRRELWVALPRGRTEEDVGDDSYTEASARGGVRRGFPQRPAPARLQRPAPPRAPPPGGGAGSAPPRAPPRPAPRHTPQARPATGHWLRDYQIPRGWDSGDLCLSGLLGPGVKTNLEGFPRHPDFKYPVLSSE